MANWFFYLQLTTRRCSLCIFVFLLATVTPVVAQSTVSISGTVTTDKGEALQFVNVQVVGTVEGASTNRQGAFSFITSQAGRQVVRASMIGFESASQTIDLTNADSISLSFVLKESLVSLDEAIVTASAYATGDAEAVTLQSLEVVTTPGAAADIFLAIKTLPGVAMVDEGAGLFVRGGDVSETVLLLDQATVAHPYKYESPTGGVFGTIPPFLVGGTYFSSGGYSAKYGNALSGVLAMKSQDMPEVTTLAANLGLAAASLGADLPIIPGKLGVRFSGNQSFTEMMMRVNGFADEFTTTPRGTDANLSVIYKYSTTGRIKFFNYTNHDRVGVFVDEPSFVGVYRGTSANWLHNLQWSDIVNDWLVQASLSLNRYETHRQLGSLDFRPEDTLTKLRVDAERDVSDRLRILVGAEYESLNNAFRGNIPVQDNILDPDSDVYALDEQYTGNRAGAYGEAQVKVTRRIAAIIGLRTDRSNLTGKTTLDPRFSLRYAFTQQTDLRLAWGLYHQISDAYTFNPASGNTQLLPQRAQHFIVGVNHEKNLLQMRLEGYYKPYDALVIEQQAVNFANEGEGEAYGLDAFIKYGGFLQTRANGWISYSFLHSNRTQPRYRGAEVVHQMGPSPFDITHNLTVVAKVRLIQFLSAGVTYRYATGRPFTPVVDAVPVENGAFYLPVEGDVGSERLPDFQRVDASLSYYLPFGQGHNATFYLAINNLLNRVNVLDYEYALDYSSRTARTSNYRRFVYLGVAINFNRVPR